MATGQECPARKRRTYAVLILAVVSLSVQGCGRSHAVPTDPATEKAIVAGDWQKVFDCTGAWLARDPRNATPAFVGTLAQFRLHEEKEARRNLEALTEHMTREDYHLLDSWGQELVKRHPDSARAWQVASQAAHWGGAQDRARADANKAVELDPHDPWSFVALAYADLGRPQDVIRDCDRALAIDPRQPDALRLRATGYIDRGQLRRGIEDLNRAIALIPQWPEALVARAGARQALGEPHRAMDDLNRAVALDPSYGSALVERARVEAAMGREKQAKQDAEEGISFLLHAGTAEGCYSRGAAHAVLGDQQAAIEDYSRAIALDAGRPGWYVDRAWEYGDLKEWDRVIADTTKAIGMGGFRTAEAYKMRGAAYAEKKDWTDAMADLSRSIELSPGDPSGYRGRGIAYAKQGKPDKALSDFDRALKLAPEKTKKVLEPDRKWLEAAHAWPPGLK